MTDTDPIDVEFHEVLDTETGELVPVAPKTPLRRRKSGNLGGTVYPDWVEETYFRAWVANLRRSGEQFREFARRNWEQFAPEGAEFWDVPLPTINTWLRVRKWHDRATTDLAANFPDHHFRDTARLIEIGSEALEFLADVVRGNVDKVQARDRVKAAEIILVGRGLGTFGSVNRTMPTIRTRTIDVAKLTNMTPQEVNEIRQKAIREGKSEMEERKR